MPTALVPIWRRMSASQYVSDFTQTISRTDKVQPALLVVAAVSAIGFAITGEGTARLLAALGAGGLVLVLLASLAILVPLQRRIIALDQSDEIEAMRTRWFSGNLGRSILSVTSFALLVVAAII